MSAVDPWVVIEGLSRREMFQEVERRCATWSDQHEVTVFPTTGGTLIHTDTKDWKQRLHDLASSLHADGFSGSITAPPVSIDDPPPISSSGPGLYLAHLQVPPLTEGPFNEYGMPTRDWSTPEPAHTELLERMVSWALSPGYQGFSGWWKVPVTLEDAVDILGDFSDGPHADLRAWNNDQTQIRRKVLRERWGRSTWVDHDPATDRVARARALASLLGEFAPVICTGFVRAAGRSPGFGSIQGVWGRHPEAWNHTVVDAHAIQVLTAAHLDSAHDLSGWNISEISPDRYLVTANDLEPWFNCDDITAVDFSQFPDRELVAQARADFGSMIYSPRNLP